MKGLSKLIAAPAVRAVTAVGVVAVLLALPARAQDVDGLVLPVYRVSIDEAELAALDADPWSDVTRPASCTVEGATLPCAVRYRGGTSRALDKKGWRLEFESDDNPLGVEKVNLKAEARDPSMTRSVLGMALFSYLGEPASRARYVNLFVNDAYAGVFVQVERVDERFFARRALPADALYKLDFHGGHFAPLMRDEDYLRAWAPRIRPAYAEVQRMLSRLHHWTPDDFAAGVEALFDVDNVLTYYAVQYALVNQDAFTQNAYVYRGGDGRYRLVPWDLDATFGNAYDGTFHPDAWRYGGQGAIRSVLFQRLVEHDVWREAFARRLETIVEGGFDRLLEEVERLAAHIEHDVTRDPTQPDGGQAFAGSVEQVEAFLRRRRGFLRSREVRPRVPVTDVWVSDAFPTPEAPEVVVRVRSAAPQDLSVMLVEDFVYAGWDTRYSKAYVPLFDDGAHGDLAAGDLVYGARIDLSGQAGRLVPFALQRQGAGTEPASAAFYTFAVPAGGYAFNVLGRPASAYERVVIDGVDRAGGNVFVRLVNPTADALDLSLCYLQGPSYHDRRIFPYGTRLPGRDTLVVASSAPVAARQYGGGAVVGGLFFDVAAGDTLRLLSPARTVLAEHVVGRVERVAGETPPVAINEISYNAAPPFAAGDWVELHNPGGSAADLGGWQLKDGDDTHVFSFDDGTTVPPGGYLVVAQAAAALRAVHPTLEHASGDLSFGLSGAGEHLRLFDAWGIVADSLTYGDRAPWPALADGAGRTLELRDPSLDNADPASWAASGPAGGTPGRTNSPLLERSPTPVVVNEVNYRAHASLDAGDWIELHNAGATPADLAGWQLGDGDGHVFVFAPGVRVPPYGYLVLGEDTAAFDRVFPDVDRLPGSLGFGLSGQGERVQLYDETGRFADSLAYDDDAPWPAAADGGGYTLERRWPEPGTHGAAYWRSSRVRGGTPGRRNSVYEAPPGFGRGVLAHYPNPFRETATVIFNVDAPGRVTLEVYDVLGRRVRRLVDVHREADVYPVRWDASGLAAGTYFYVLSVDGRIEGTKAVVHVP